MNNVIKLVPKHRSLSKISIEIMQDWKTWQKSYAKPYLEAMVTLDQITDVYMLDTAESVVLYFLSNATHWRGITARNIKLELKKIIKDLNNSVTLRQRADRNSCAVYGVEPPNEQR